MAARHNGRFCIAQLQGSRHKIPSGYAAQKAARKFSALFLLGNFRQ
jgi:hypothetical protein